MQKVIIDCSKPADSAEREIVVSLSQEEIDAAVQLAQIAAAAQPRLDVLSQIATLEAQQTSRRIREAALGIDGGFMAGLEAQIAALRAQLV